MEAYILFAATRFGLSPHDARKLTGALLWVMQLHAGEQVASIHALDAQVRRLIEQAPAALVEARRSLPFFAGPGRVCGTQASLLRLFARQGFSLAATGRFAQALLGWLSVEVGTAAVWQITESTPVLLLLLEAANTPQASARRVPLSLSIPA